MAIIRSNARTHFDEYNNRPNDVIYIWMVTRVVVREVVCALHVVPHVWYNVVPHVVPHACDGVWSSAGSFKGSPYQKNLLANVVGHLKHIEGGWCFFTSSFVYGLQGPSNVFGLKFRPTSLCFLFQQTPRTRGLNGKNYRKTLRVLIVGLLETIRCGLFFSQNICKYGH